ncbi:hypothetical protein KR084_000145, partial [Drosophila pseudotakahashii]
MNSQHFLVLLHLSLILVYAYPSKNSSYTSFRRVKRLSYGKFNDEALRLSKYVVSVRTRTASVYFGDNHFCSGVILTPLFALTSAHCLINDRRVLYDSRTLLVVAGSVNRFKYIPGRSFLAPVDKIIMPDNFTLRNKQDMALLKVTKPFPRTYKHISLAKLPIRPPKAGLECLVGGWGQMFEGGPRTAKMLYIDVTLISTEECHKRLNVKEIDFLCAVDPDPFTTQQPCIGDLGAPLIHDDVVYGIVSVLMGCGTGGWPSVYVDVYTSVKWIEGKIISNGGTILSVSIKSDYFNQQRRYHLICFHQIGLFYYNIF